jgi:hypothetical protein
MKGVVGCVSLWVHTMAWSQEKPGPAEAAYVTGGGVTRVRSLGRLRRASVMGDS